MSRGDMSQPQTGARAFVIGTVHLPLFLLSEYEILWLITSSLPDMPWGLLFSFHKYTLSSKLLQPVQFLSTSSHPIAHLETKGTSDRTCPSLHSWSSPQTLRSLQAVSLSGKVPPPTLLCMGHSGHVVLLSPYTTQAIHHGGLSVLSTTLLQFGYHHYSPGRHYHHLSPDYSKYLWTGPHPLQPPSKLVSILQLEEKGF